MTPACAACRYWQAMYPQSETGWCCRHAPRPQMAVPPGSEPLVWWPVTEKINWCGEFAAPLEVKP
jgi:hypothetical protein